MADRHCVASGNWSATSTWSDTKDGTPGFSVPGQNDNVFLDSATARTLTVDGTPSCLNFTAEAPSSGNHTLAGSAPLNIYGSMTLYAGLDNTFSGDISFKATATGKTITTAGVALGSAINFDGVGGGWQFQDSFTQNKNATHTTASVTLVNGSLDMNGKTVVMRFFQSNNANVRTLLLGAANITLNGQNTNHWNLNNSPNLTFNAGTSLITINNGSTTSFSGGDRTYYDLVYNHPNGGIGFTMNGNNTFRNLSIIWQSGTSTAGSKPDLAGNITVTGLLTVTGNAANSRVTIVSTDPSLPRTITAHAVSLTNVDFIGITAAGDAAPFTGTSLGDGGRNSNIIFDAPVTRYLKITSGTNWSNPANWSTTSGGATGASVPLPQDQVYLDANSGSGTIVRNMVNSGKNIDCTGDTGLSLFTGTLQISQATSNINGNLILNATMNATLSASSINFRGTGNQRITTAGKSFSGTTNFIAHGGVYTLYGDLITTGQFQHNSGTFDANGYNVTTSFFNCAGTVTRTLIMGSGTWEITGTGTVWLTAIQQTIVSTGSTIKITDASASDKTFAGGGKTYNNLWFTGAGTGKLIVTSSNVFNDLKVDTAPKTVQLPASGTQTVGSLTLTGSAGNPITLQSSSGSTAYIINRGVYDSPQDVTLTNVTIAVEYQTGEGVLTVSDPSAVPRGEAETAATGEGLSVSDAAVTTSGAAAASLAADAVTISDPAAEMAGGAIAAYLTELLSVIAPEASPRGAAQAAAVTGGLTVSDPVTSAIGSAVAAVLADVTTVSDPEATMLAAAYVTLAADPLAVSDPLAVPVGAALILLASEIVTVSDAYVEAYPIISGGTFTASPRLFVFSANERLFTFTARS